MKLLSINESGLVLVAAVEEGKPVRLLHFSALPYDATLIEDGQLSGFRLAEVQLSGQDRPEERHGAKYTVTSPGYRLGYRAHSDEVNETGRKLVFTQADEETGLVVESHFQFYAGLPAARCWAVAKNSGGEAQTLEYLPCFALNGVEKEGLLAQDEKMRLHVPHNSWQRELQWQAYTLPQLGLQLSQPAAGQRSSKAAGASNTGNWSTKEYLPMGVLENTETASCLFWQIEHSGSWHWEISDQTGHLYLQVGGPNEIQSHWSVALAPGQSFESVPACVGAVAGDRPFEKAMQVLTLYRRTIRRPNDDNERLPVIFNDYLHCLDADPTTDRELPIIDIAADLGCEYYCIDAGWYDEGYWWDGVGEWQPCEKRFPGGIKKVIDYIRAKGMTPGLWLEIEVMGKRSPMLSRTDDSWFFTRHGKRVYDRSRLQLDFRSPAVVAHATEVVRRLVEDYGVGYIKMDYNIEPGIGTEQHATSFGDGLLQHQRAYLAWVDALFEKYPKLIIEACSSGGMRMDYAMLRRHSIQSVSDQEDYRFFTAIAAKTPTGVTPEQAAVWSYPLEGATREDTAYNMVNAMLLRIHQSGAVARLAPECLALVQEGIACYKTYRGHIRTALPVWPLGLATFSDAWACLGLQSGGKLLLAVWRQNTAEATCTLPLPQLAGKTVSVKRLYPGFANEPFQWNPDAASFSASLPQPYSARLFELDLQ